MMLKLTLLRFLTAGVLLAVLAGNAWALIAYNQNYNFNFRFNTPGARANAMGGAFIGLADDATAAYSNPAGLINLFHPQVSLEYKLAKYENTFYYTDSTGYDFDEKSNGSSFLSLAYPLGRATFTAYRHLLVNFSSDYSVDNLLFSAEIDIKVATYGLGVGLKLTDTLSLGFSLGFSQQDYYYVTDFFADPSLKPPPILEYRVDGEDTAENFTASLLCNPFSNFSLGLVYRKGPEFTTIFETFIDMEGDGDYDGVQATKNTLKIPDVYGVGASFRFPFGLTAAADVNYVEYSDILEDFRFPNGTDRAGIDWRISDYDVDDIYEIHVGLEYLFDIRKIPFSVRGGYFFKPDHRITYEGPRVSEQNAVPEGDDDNIFTFGVGAVFFGNIQIDTAASIGDFEQEYTFSFVYRLD